MKRAEQVFPLIATSTYQAFGLSKRELFAAIALSGFASDRQLDPELAAKYALEAADHLLEKLSSKPESRYCEQTGYALGGRP